MLLGSLLLILISPINFVHNTPCLCRKVKATEVTRSSTVLAEIAEKRVKSLQGKVLYPSDPSSPLEDALVEVFTRADLVKRLSLGAAERERKQKRIAACITSEDGKFCFKGIPAGRYELRISRDGFSIASGVVIIDPKVKQNSSAAIVVKMGLSM